MSTDRVSGETYDVAVDRPSLKAAVLGGGETGYTVELKGLIDARWIESYRRLRTESPSFYRFYLDDRNASVLFACRARDIQADILTVLKILDSLVEQVNRHASSAS